MRIKTSEAVGQGRRAEFRVFRARGSKTFDIAGERSGCHWSRRCFFASRARVHDLTARETLLGDVAEVNDGEGWLMHCL